MYIMIICHCAILHYHMSFKTIAWMSGGVFWWFPALSEDQEKICWIHQNYLVALICFLLQLESDQNSQQNSTTSSGGGWQRRDHAGHHAGRAQHDGGPLAAGQCRRDDAAGEAPQGAHPGAGHDPGEAAEELGDAPPAVGRVRGWPQEG